MALKRFKSQKYRTLQKRRQATITRSRRKLIHLDRRLETEDRIMDLANRRRKQRHLKRLRRLDIYSTARRRMRLFRPKSLSRGKG